MLYTYCDNIQNGPSMEHVKKGVAHFRIWEGQVPVTNVHSSYSLSMSPQRDPEPSFPFFVEAALTGERRSRVTAL